MKKIADKFEKGRMFFKKVAELFLKITDSLFLHDDYFMKVPKEMGQIDLSCEVPRLFHYFFR